MKKTDKDRLEDVINSKLRTTMIGAIASIESHFAELINHSKYRAIFDETRKEILDLGNKQMRNMSSELDNYDVSWNKWSITLTPYRKERDEN
jgi:hypothetical protein